LGFSFDISIRDNGKIGLYNVDKDLGGKVTLDKFMGYLRSTLIQVAHNALREEQARGFPKKEYITRVDGSFTKPVEKVNPFGKISISRYDSSVATEDILDMYKAILERSKVVTGTYIDHNYVLFKGVTVARSISELSSWLSSRPKVVPGDRLIFVNITPYARRLERLGVRAGSTSERFQKYSKKTRSQYNKIKTHFSAPNGAYYLAYRSIRREDKGKYRLKFDFISGSTLQLDRVTIRNKRTGSVLGKKKFNLRKSDKGPARAYVYPSIVVTFIAEA
jgi:hypothetical protein